MIKLFRKIKSYHFETQHMIALILVLIFFQVILSVINNRFSSSLLSSNMEIYRRDLAENLADLSTTSLELLIEHNLLNPNRSNEEKRNAIRSFNIIFSQKFLQPNVKDICVVLFQGDSLVTVDDGRDLYNYFVEEKAVLTSNIQEHLEALNMFQDVAGNFFKEEQIEVKTIDSYIFHVYVPFVPMGELKGAVYMKIVPDIGGISHEIKTVYNDSGTVFSALILLGLFAMFLITSYVVRERDTAQKQLFEKEQQRIAEQIAHEKEALFTRRIYHTHHKAEKVMGFIKEDVRLIKDDVIRSKITKYANFISRVIYDMKSYNPPISVIRGPVFNTDLNQLLTFLTENIFGRVHRASKMFSFQLNLDENLPKVHINEYVIWEVLEPLIQNSIDHNNEKSVTVTLTTEYNPDDKISKIIIEDDGRGIPAKYLELNEKGIKRIFDEHITSKDKMDNSGYGCFLAWDIATRRLGWELDADNHENGARFTITIKGS